MTSSRNSASVAASSSGCFLMTTLGTNLFQSFHVSVLRTVRKTRAAGALIVSVAWTMYVAEAAGTSGVDQSLSPIVARKECEAQEDGCERMSLGLFCESSTVVDTSTSASC